MIMQRLVSSEMRTVESKGICRLKGWEGWE